MHLTDHAQRYGLISIVLHWSMAIAFIGLFILGKYMVDLDYYSRWYQTAPDFHRSIGVLISLLMLLRWGWRRRNRQPAMHGSRWEKIIAVRVHGLFYLLVPVIALSGYMTITAEGQALYVFDWFNIPATLSGFANQADSAGAAHELFTTIFVLLAGFHAIAALKHHFIDHDATLQRMLGRSDSDHYSSLSGQSKEE